MGVPVATRQTAQPQRADPQRSPSHPGSQAAACRETSSIDRLQRTVGNRAINRLLRSQTIQPKLTVSQPDDPFEREADRVADQVMRMPEPQSRLAPRHAPPTIQRACHECEDKLHRQPVREGELSPHAENGTAVHQRPESASQLSLSQGPLQISRICTGGEKKLHRQPRKEATTEPDEEEAIVHAKRVSGDPPEVSSELESYLANSRGSGQPLSDSARAYFEPRFGHDFSNVRVHTDRRAEQASGEISARAFTAGPDIYFAEGQCRPGTASGDRLLGHELTHVVQQQGAGAGVTAGANFAHVQRQEPVTTVTFGAVVAKCIIGAITGALFDAAIQAALSSWRRRSWRFWETQLNWCSIILSAIIGCFAGPVSAYILEPWIAARLGPSLAMAGTLLGKFLLFIAKKLAMVIPKSIVSKLAKLNCISPEQSAELGVPVESIT